MVLAVRAIQRSATQRAQHVTAVAWVSSILMGLERGRFAMPADGQLAARIIG